MQTFSDALPVGRSGQIESAAASPFRVIEADYRNDPRWVEFLSSHRDALIYHHPGWLAALEEEYGRKCTALACEGPDGRFHGILPLMRTRGLPWRLPGHAVGKRLSSLPRTPLCGPLAASGQALAALIEAATALVRREPGLQLELKTTTAGLEALVPSLQSVSWRDTFIRGLPKNDAAVPLSIGPWVRAVRPCTSCESCRDFSFGNARDNHQVKWAVQKARKLGLSMRGSPAESDLRAWYRLYLSTMRRNAVPPRPLRFFRQLLKELQPLGMMELVLADRESCQAAQSQEHPAPIRVTGEPTAVSGSILLEFGHTVFWAFTGSEDGGSRDHSNDLTLWNCMHASCKAGYSWFDLGEVAESHPELIQFKAKWGTLRKPMYRYYYPAIPRPKSEDARAGSTPTTLLLRSLWRRLPLPVIAQLGDWLFSYL